MEEGGREKGEEKREKILGWEDGRREGRKKGKGEGGRERRGERGKKERQTATDIQ